MSTEFRIGMGEGRNSSRVLKPPGGGHSQIFGEPEEEAPRKIHARTEISGCFGTEAKVVQEKTDVQEKVVKELEENTTNGNNGTVTDGSNHTNGTTIEEKRNEINAAKTESSTPERKRVPPGGFSSGGFW